MILTINDPRVLMRRWTFALGGFLATYPLAPARVYGDEHIEVSATGVASIDSLAAQDLGWDAPATWPQVDDATFLRRATLDVLGRRPTLEEQTSFLHDSTPDRRLALIERLLGDPGFGINWANYWNDLIAYRVVPPAEVVLDYQPFKDWLAAEWNAGRPWSQIVRQIVTATGRIDERPPVTFMAYHEAQPTKLAAETARLFLGQQIGCAECHDHPFDHWTREQFHQYAAAFAGLEILRRQGGAADGVALKPGGEYRTPDVEHPGEFGPPIAPASLTDEPLRADDPRVPAAEWLTHEANPWFARAFVNHVWTRLIGRGLSASVDSLGDASSAPRAHAELAKQFVHSDFDERNCFRTLLQSRLYAHPDLSQSLPPLALRGDEVFESLSGALAEAFPPAATASPVEPAAEGDPLPPPKKPRARTERELVAEGFGYDPALRADQLQPTIGQALYLMNHPRLQQEIDAAGASETMLSGLLACECDDAVVVETLYRRVLGRGAAPVELRIFSDHRSNLGNRDAAFEDLLWSLVNSAEFLTRQ